MTQQGDGDGNANKDARTGKQGAKKTDGQHTKGMERKTSMGCGGGGMHGWGDDGMQWGTGRVGMTRM